MKPLKQALIGVLIRRGNADTQRATRNARTQRKVKTEPTNKSLRKKKIKPANNLIWDLQPPWPSWPDNGGDGIISYVGCLVVDTLAEYTCDKLFQDLTHTYTNEYR